MKGRAFLKVAIDISPIIYGTGVSVYTKNLLDNLFLLDHINKYMLFGGSLRRYKELKNWILRYRDTTRGNTDCKAFLIPPTLADLIWNKMHILPIERLIGKIDVFHSSDWVQPPSRAFKVTTVHDLSPILLPDFTHPRIVSAHNMRLKWVINEVDRVIVPSNTTAEDAQRIGIKKERIRVIPEAVDPVFKPVKKEEIENLKRKYRISGNYVLAVGVNLRKNTKRIVDAFEKVKAEIDLRLVVIGYPYSKMENPKGVIFTGHVSQNELPGFYSGAEALVYPSLYEGFGLPILEAYKSETPVVTSNLGSMAEIGKGAAILVDPNVIDSISEGIKSALRNKKGLIKKGLQKAKEFSWQKTAEETLKVYSEAK